MNFIIIKKKNNGDFFFTYTVLFNILMSYFHHILQQIVFYSASIDNAVTAIYTSYTIIIQMIIQIIILI